MKPHKHWKEIAQYAQDAAETEKPWERWQYKSIYDADWIDGKVDFAFYQGWEYRRKPRFILINGIEVPEPMREKPEFGASYWIPDIWDTSGRLSSSEMTWEDHETDNDWFFTGICHLTREAAELHAKALLSFTKKEGRQ